MGKKISRANNSFLLGTFVLMILLFLTVFLFLMWAFRAFDKDNAARQKGDTFEFILDKSTLDKPMSLYVNDSLIFSGTPSAAITLQINRFADESTLLAVDGETDKVSPIGLPDKSARLLLKRVGDSFTALPAK